VLFFTLSWDYIRNRMEPFIAVNAIWRDDLSGYPFGTSVEYWIQNEEAFVSWLCRGMRGLTFGRFQQLTADP
jgi:hypothetical protein